MPWKQIGQLLVAAFCLLEAALFLRSALSAYRDWRHYLAVGDHSTAGLFELSFHMTLWPGAALLLLGCFLFGHWFRRRRD